MHNLHYYLKMPDLYIYNVEDEKCYVEDYRDHFHYFSNPM